jgi:hypothetical protein
MSMSNYFRTLDAMRYAGRKLSAVGTSRTESSQVCSGASHSKPGALPVHAVAQRGKRLYAVERGTVTDSVTRSRIPGNWQKLPGTARRAVVVRNYR